MAYLFGLLIVLAPFVAAAAGAPTSSQRRARTPRARFGGVMTVVIAILGLILGLIVVAAVWRVRWLLGLLFLLVCLALIAAVLLQKGRGGGLGAAFGGAGNSAFGTKTGDAWTVVTIVLTFLFLLIASVATYTYRPEDTKVPAPFFLVDGLDEPVRTEGTVEVPSGFSVSMRSPMPGTTIQYAWDGQELSENQIGSRLVDLVFEDGQVSRTLRIQATRSGFEDSDVRSLTFTKAVPTAAAATASPVGGQINEPVEVTLSSETDSARIYYTLDGSTPNQESSLYESPITVEPGTTVKAIVYAANHKPSEVITAVFEAKESQTDTGQGESPSGEPTEGDNGGDGEDSEQSLVPAPTRQAA